MMATLLPPDALRGIRIGVSVSDSPDLGRIGLMEAHFRLTLGQIARLVLVSAGSLAYGGHLDSEGYTTFLEGELQRYGHRNQPLLVCLAWQEHRRVSLSELERRRHGLGPYGRIVCLDPDGVEVDPAEGRDDDPVPVGDPDLRRQALTAMRRYMRDHIDGRLLLGGRRHGFQGEIPGPMEEAILTLEAGQPLYLAGGYGGVTLDIVRALGIDDGSWLPRDQEAPPDDPRLTVGYERLATMARTQGWPGLGNGLTDEENRMLAVTYRSSEIATLVALGMGRWAQERGSSA